MSAVTGSRRADRSALEALVDAAAGILAADSLSDTLTRIAHHLASLVDFDEISVYEVRDAGQIRDPLAGRCRPAIENASGRGLWIVHQLSDLVQQRTRANETVTRVRFSTNV